MAAALYEDSCETLVLHGLLRPFVAGRSTSRMHIHWMLDQALQVGDAKWLVKTGIIASSLCQSDGQVEVLAGKVAFQQAVQVSMPLLTLALQAVNCPVSQIQCPRLPWPCSQIRKAVKHPSWLPAVAQRST